MLVMNVTVIHGSDGVSINISGVEDGDCGYGCGNGEVEMIVQHLML